MLVHFPHTSISRLVQYKLYQLRWNYSVWTSKELSKKMRVYEVLILGALLSETWTLKENQLLEMTLL